MLDARYELKPERAYQKIKNKIRFNPPSHKAMADKGIRRLSTHQIYPALTFERK